MSRKPTSKKPDEVRAWFKYQLKLKGSSFSAIAEELEISRQAVWEGIVNPTPRIADAVAEVLDKDRSELWPHRYSTERGQS